MNRIGYNICKNIYGQLGPENGRSAIRQISGLIQQGFNPEISRLNRNAIELKLDQPLCVITQKISYRDRVLVQNTEMKPQIINGKTHTGHRLDIISLNDVEFGHI